jgi:hypothetical protein
MTTDDHDKHLRLHQEVLATINDRAAIYAKGFKDGRSTSLCTGLCIGIIVGQLPLLIYRLFVT